MLFDRPARILSTASTRCSHCRVGHNGDHGVRRLRGGGCGEIARCLACARRGDPAFEIDRPTTSYPSCGGHAPYRGENGGPGKDDREELDCQAAAIPPSPPAPLFFDVRFANDPPELLVLRPEQSAEIGAAERIGVEALAREVADDSRLPNRVDDPGGEPRHDILWRRCRCEQAVPEVDFMSRVAGFCDGRYTRQHGGAAAGGCRERAQVSSFDLL